MKSSLSKNRKYKLDSIFNPTIFNSFDTMASFYTPFSKKVVVEKNIKTKLNNRCFLTGRSRFVFRFFKISRISIRRVLLQYRVSGLSSYSW